MTAQFLAAFPGHRMVATDYDSDMVTTHGRPWRPSATGP